MVNSWGAELTSLLGCLCQEFARARDLSVYRLGKQSYELVRKDVIGGLIARFAHV